jgi:hypothetical protein
MPVKKIKVEFELDLELFTRMLAYSNQGVAFSTYGDDKPYQVEVPKPQLALPAPKRGLRQAILVHMQQHPDKTFTSAELVAFAIELGYDNRNVHNVMHNMHTAKLVRRYSPGMYRIAKAGINHG